MRSGIRVTLRPERRNLRADLGSEKADFGPEWADFRPGRANFGTDRAFLGHERSLSSLGGADGHTDGQTSGNTHLGPKEHWPFGAAAQKPVAQGQYSSTPL